MPKKCKACGYNFRPDPRVPKQQFCSKPECQLQRRKEWLQEKRNNDPHYRENDARQIKEWIASHPDYWKQYRQKNPDYAKRNRNLQSTRNQKKRTSIIANVANKPVRPGLFSGRYELRLIGSDGIANEDVWIVEITLVSSSYDNTGA